MNLINSTEMEQAPTSYLASILQDEPELAPTMVRILETQINSLVLNAARAAAEAERETRELVTALWRALEHGQPLAPETAARIRAMVDTAAAAPYKMPRTGTS